MGKNKIVIYFLSKKSVNRKLVIFSLHFLLAKQTNKYKISEFIIFFWQNIMT
jgi:hypothetical protein